MEARQRGRAEQALQTKRDELVAAGPHRIEPNRRDVATTGVADDDEQALSEMLQTLASTRNREDAALLGSIDKALKKLRDEPDEYGACEDCGEDIPVRRLEVMPWAAYCTECQSRVDPARNVARKKLTDYR